MEYSQNPAIIQPNTARLCDHNSTGNKRTFTERGQLHTTKYDANVEDTRSYDDGGKLITSAYRNGVTTTYAYRNVIGNKDNLLASISFAHPSGAATNRLVGDLTYDSDANKNKTKETIAGTMSGYSFDTTVGAEPDGHDDENRLTHFKRSNNANPQTWELSLVGDWDSWSNLGSWSTDWISRLKVHLRLVKKYCYDSDEFFNARRELGILTLDGADLHKSAT
jgi:hypothetical protein